MSEKPWYEKVEFESAGRRSDRLLRRCGPFALTPPNVVTAVGGLAALPMFIAFRSGFLAAGTILFLFSLMTDWLDGALARFQAREEAAATVQARLRTEFFQLGPTELGKKMDPVVDKARYFLALWPLGWNILPHDIIWTSLGIALALTFFREVVFHVWGIKPGANAVGKIKVYVEAVVIAALVALSVSTAVQRIAYAAFFVATALGAASLLTQGRSILRQIKSRNP